MGLTRDQVAAGIARTPRSLPSAGQSLRALNPEPMLDEAVAGACGLTDPGTYQAARAALRTTGAVDPLLDDAARLELAAVGRLGPQARAMPGVGEFLAANRAQYLTLAGATFVPLALTGADKLGALDDLKFATVTPPR
jgi:hypothetical protein